MNKEQRLLRPFIILMIGSVIALYGISELYTFGLFPFGFGFAILVSELMNIKDIQLPAKK